MNVEPTGEDTGADAGRDDAGGVPGGASGWDGARASLVLADGEVFRGRAFGAIPTGGVARGDLVFSTVMSGYQEVISDPANGGNVVVFAYPQIGNVGVNAADEVSDPSACRGVVLRDLSRITSNWRAEEDLVSYLERNGIPGITGVDTRRLVLHLREHGPLRGAFGTADAADLLDAARSADPDDGGSHSSGGGEDPGAVLG